MSKIGDKLYPTDNSYSKCLSLPYSLPRLLLAGTHKQPAVLVTIISEPILITIYDFIPEGKQYEFVIVEYENKQYLILNRFFENEEYYQYNKKLIRNYII